jgi:hypothetical protein
MAAQNVGNLTGWAGEAQWKGYPMTDRIRVTEAELKRHWFGPASTGMIHDHRAQVKVVVMADGTEYETPFAELPELQAGS